MSNMDFYQFLNHENVRVNSITPSQKNFIRENLELTNLEDTDIDFISSKQAKEEIEKIIRIKNEEEYDIAMDALAGWVTKHGY
ncbi:hypothetical protein QLX23_gp210 [Staphylococcus phage ISP]|uniref:Uncharacterized protein n=24 Tax=Kayvirus TaxID=1857843 RepID=I6WA23_9CAUD|nr:hypothetical protein QLX23_gp210 [Staphylococcus phage ISP]YP_009780513.1 hypothetical protein QLX29_gp039 [Staphylococcus phage Staph1N]YP_009780958.1 hypothetical protein QLX31_gp040 [Staphylococcus phage 676Z]YP_009781423.1 hypothetical protein QLX33_gp039 [Staphylococcus phage MSA6]YP_009781887.1 gpORF020 [Staphylococcus phage A5W]ACB89011.1 gpORF020 [Staphylococcus phage A5W]AFN37858.1 hypothetical protein phi_Staph_1N_ORF020 [Staphylococcus phage Staph1N]AFN38262.1 hypothetical prot